MRFSELIQRLMRLWLRWIYPASLARVWLMDLAAFGRRFAMGTRDWHESMPQQIVSLRPCQLFRPMMRDLLRQVKTACGLLQTRTDCCFESIQRQILCDKRSTCYRALTIPCTSTGPFGLRTSNEAQ